MFSVGASPFNSRSRQLYGGWTLQEAGNNPWALRQWHEMSAKYNASPGARRASREWLRAYRELPLATRKLVNSSGRPYWNKALKKALTDAQKAQIWAEWQTIPLSADNGYEQWRSAMMRHAPYPSVAAISTYPYATAPASVKVEGYRDLTAADMANYIRTAQQLAADRRAARRTMRERIAAEMQAMIEPQIEGMLAAPAAAPLQRAAARAAARLQARDAAAQAVARFRARQAAQAAAQGGAPDMEEVVGPDDVELG